MIRVQKNLCITRLYASGISWYSVQNEASLAAAVHQLLPSMYPPHVRVLGFLLDHLRVVIDHADTVKLSGTSTHPGGHSALALPAELGKGCMLALSQLSMRVLMCRMYVASSMS